MATHSSGRRTLVKICLSLATVLAVVAAFWIGGNLSDDEAVAKGLSVALVALVGAGGVVIARRDRSLRLPVGGSYLAAVAAVGGWLLLGSTRDIVVNEQVDTVASPVAAGAEIGNATPRGTVSSTTTRVATATATATPRPVATDAPATPVRVSAGVFADGAHPTSGTATILHRADGTALLTLTGFATSPGPDLRVRVLDKAGRATDLADLKGNKGDQQYLLPAGLDPATLAGVSIWCRAFTVEFGMAELL